MDILFIAAAHEPGGARPEAETVTALTKALRGLGHKVTVLSPLYKEIDPMARALARRLTKIEVSAGDSTAALELYTGRTPSGVDLVYLGHEELFGAVSDLSEGEATDIAKRTGAFARGALRYMLSLDASFDVVHGIGVAGAAAVATIRRGEGEGRAALLVHVVDPSDQGQFSGEAATALGLGDSAEHGGGENALKAGLLAADAVTASSSTRARALREEPRGFGLESVYRELGPRLHGILLGIDGSVWNPLTDAHLPARFDPIDRRGKARTKATLQRQLALPIRDDIPLIGVIGRTDPGMGMDVLTKVAAKVLRNDVQLVVQVEGGGELIEHLEDLWDRWPDRIQIRTGSDVPLAHRIVGASDLFVLPVDQGPATQLTVAVQRYGALPIASQRSDFAEAIVDCDPALATGSGFLFAEATEDELLAAIRRGIAAFTNREAFEGLRSRAMRIDRSLDRSARHYERVYRDVLAQRVTAVAPDLSPTP